MSYLTDQIAEMRQQIADLRANKVTYIKVPVVAADPDTGTFAVGVDTGNGGVSLLDGLDASKHHLPAVGSDATLALVGGQPVFQPGAIAEGTIGEAELTPEVTDAIADSVARSETAIGQAEAANAAASQAANAALAADGAALDAAAAATLSAQKAEAARLAAEAAEATSGEVTGSVLAAQEAADQANEAAQESLAQATAAGATVETAQAAATAAQNAATAANTAAGAAGTSAAAADAKAAQAAADAAKAAADALLAKEQADAARQAAQDAAASAGQAVTVAQTAANGKNSVFYSLNVAPTTGNTGRVNGDTWFRRDANGVIIGQWEWVTNAWVVRTVGSQVIANLDVGKLTTGDIAAGQKISAGPRNGTHAEMASDGFRVFVEDTTDNIPNEVVRMGTATNDFIAVVGADGNLKASIDDTGRGNFSAVTTESLTVAGRSIAASISDAPRGEVAHWLGSPGFDLAPIFNPVGVAEVGLSVERGRSYHFKWRMSVFVNAGVQLQVNGRWEQGVDGDTITQAPAPTINSTSFAEWKSFPAGDNKMQTVYGEALWVATRTTRVRFGITAQVGPDGNIGFVAVKNAPVEINVLDVGRHVGRTGGFSNMGGQLNGTVTPPPPQNVSQQYFVDLAPAGRASWQGSGALMNWAGNDVYQGYQSANGDTRGQFWFNLPNITGTVDRVDIWIYFRHWHYNSGGTVRMGITDQRGVFTGHSFRGLWETGGWPKPGAREVMIPADWWPLFRGTDNNSFNGRGTCITLGPGGGTNPLFYGVATDARLRIYYTQ